MKSDLRRAVPTLAGYLDERIVRWRTGTSEGQIAVVVALMIASCVILVGSLFSYSAFPAATFVIPLLLGTMTLRYWPLLALVTGIFICIAITVAHEYIRAVDAGLPGMTGGRLSTLITMVIVAWIVLYESSRHRSGLPGPLGEAMLVDLRDKLQAQGVVPALPEGWSSQSAMTSANGAKFAGDFLVANLSDDETKLEMILVDVCGKGLSAGTQSLQLAGALGGLIGALPPLGLFAAGNDFLMRQDWNDGFATAVHVVLDLRTGKYSIINAGHPPALHWSAAEREWTVDGARGMALGIMKRPDFRESEGTLGPGDALMFYTDGVVESRTQDFTAGIDWLRESAKEIVEDGFDQAPRKILKLVSAGDDDRAVLILSRDAVPTTPAVEAPVHRRADTALS